MFFGFTFGEEVEIGDDLGEFLWGGEFTGGEGGEFAEEIEFGGEADFFEGWDGDDDLGFEVTGGGGALDIDGVSAAFAWGELASVHGPLVIFGGELDGFLGAAGGGEGDGDLAFGDGDAEGSEDRGIEADFIAAFGGFWGVEEADAFVLGEVALVSHPANDLAPEAIVVGVFDAATPAPSGIGAHVEDLAIASGAGDEEGESTAGGSSGFVNGEDFGAWFGFDDWGVPIEAGEGAPDGLVGGGVGGEHGQPVVASAGGEVEAGFGAAGEAGAFGVIGFDGQKIGEGGIGEGFLASEGSGEEDEAAGLLFDEALDHLGIFGGEHFGTDADIAEEDDIVALEILAFGGKFFEVAFAFAEADGGVIEDRIEGDAGVAEEGVAEVTEFPTGLGIDD